ncbi:MAG TPA: leucyl/phenylalanyl-tRNA--protein transferase [Treponema sp.]|nr:leucyl/phenylalanyl-tRNA--protein transferase [Treponema sp.]
MGSVIDPENIIAFPPPRSAAPFRNICAVTQDIPLQLLYSAYMQGIFPWFDETEGEPVLWYSPEPRFCLRMEKLHVPRSIERFLRRSPFTYTMDCCFGRVMEECRDMRRLGQHGSWIGDKMLRAYSEFHEAGYAHSVEAWHNGELAGGFYGVLIGSVFCGESMFTKESGSSKSAFVLFARAFASCGGKLIDSQVYTENIARYGAENISRDAFLRLEGDYLHKALEKNLPEAFLALAGSYTAGKP